MTENQEKLLRLTSRQADGILSADEHRELMNLLQANEHLVDLYADYLCLHAQLTWDAGCPPMATVAETSTAVQDQWQDLQPQWHDLQPSSRSMTRWLAGTTTALLLLIGSLVAVVTSIQPNEDHVAESPDPSGNAVSTIQAEEIAVAENDENLPDLTPLEVTNHRSSPTEVAPIRGNSDDAVASRNYLPARFSDDAVTTKLDEFIRSGWRNHEIESAPSASDSEWVRRIYLTFAGRIPTFDESSSYINDNSPRKRTALIDRLLNSTARAKHLATVWSNLLIGRTPRRGVNREMLFEYLVDAFEKNTPWIDTVGELITATGRNDENGATNFLLAHLNNQATPATAVTARLFLGEQISCVQCHDHPFSPGIKQETYWALNAFFKDTERVVVREPESARSKYMTCRLVDRRQVERITHYETLQGQMKAVLPGFNNVIVPEDSRQNRRELLAELLSEDSDTRIARAMVNRVWAHFFGYGFTTPIDDMGPHATISHPELLEMLSEAFVKSDYDVRRLMRWIALSDTWQLSSEAGNATDMPEHGTTPLFSRVYARRMSPEQVYESVRVAIRSTSGVPIEHDHTSLEHRRRWVAQFARNYQTDENDEYLNFEGTIGQAMVMMNGVEVDQAIHQATQAILSNVPSAHSESMVLNRLAASVLCREPTSEEKKAFRAYLRDLSSHRAADAASQAVEDMMWAYLNSSEFVLVH